MLYKAAILSKKHYVYSNNSYTVENLMFLAFIMYFDHQNRIIDARI